MTTRGESQAMHRRTACKVLIDTGQIGGKAVRDKNIPGSGHRFRYGLRSVLIVFLVAAIYCAYQFPPRHFQSADVDISVFKVPAIPPALVGPGTPATSLAEDHCIGIRSPKIISEALNRHPELLEVAGDANAVQWIHDRVVAIAVDDKTVRLLAIGSIANEQEVELVVSTLAETYNAWLAESTGRSPAKIIYDAGPVGVKYRSVDLVEF